MILDSSAIVGMLRKEPGYESLAEKVLAAGTVGVGTPTLVETEIVLVGRFDRQGRVLLRNFVVDKKIDVISFGEQHWREAGRAFVHYGKGRHRAALNLGDCMTYAIVRLAGESLMYTGDDFAETDLA